MSRRSVRARNAKAFAAFGIEASAAKTDSHFRIIRSSGKTTIFTVGYEKRTGEELVALLIEAGVEAVVDIREKPMSRKVDFRGSALQARCEEAGMSYYPMPELGSTQQQRKSLIETGDIKAFHRRYRAYARKHLGEPLTQLATLVRKNSIALLCYERSHEDCHRSTVADLIADRVGSTVVAII